MFNKATYNDADGDLAGLVGVMLDITDLRRTADEREHAIARLKKTRAELKRLSISDGLTGLATGDISTTCSVVNGAAPSVLTCRWRC